jgi:hypothetical protein
VVTGPCVVQRYDELLVLGDDSAMLGLG